MGYWRDRTPEGFTFNVKAFSLLTQHPTQPRSLYKDLREKVPDKKNLYLRDVPEEVVACNSKLWTDAPEPNVADVESYTYQFTIASLPVS